MSNSGSQYVWVATILYSIFAILFGIVLFTNPTKKLNTPEKVTKDL